jgi:hypothetical protein
MVCCPKIRAGEFFEHGIGKFILILFVLLVTGYVIYFTLRTFSCKGYLPNTFIEFKQERDLFIGKNDAGYKGYIRFETYGSHYPGGRQEQNSMAKIVLQRRKGGAFNRGVRIEFFDNDRAFITDLLLQKDSFNPEEFGYSYNKLPLGLPNQHALDKIKYFRYNLIPGQSQP